jgi:hypothetical protein
MRVGWRGVFDWWIRRKRVWEGFDGIKESSD